MLHGRDIVCLSSIDWDFIWQGHQEIMSTLATQGNRVLFVENTGVRTPNLRDLPRLRRRIRNWLHSTKGFRQERENLFVYSPLILPFPYSRLACRVNRWLLLRALHRWMKATGFGRPIVWTFLPTPLARDMIRELDPELIVYYCIDDFASSSHQAKKSVRSEQQLFREADLVFVTSEKLRQRAAQFSPRVHLFPFGVNFEQFQAVRETPENGVPAEIQRLPRPVVGYVGGVHRWVDQELLAEAARALPEASFVFVGPPQTDVSTLARCPNVHLLGKKAHTDLPAYIKGFDVGIIPYRLSDYTANVYPTKVNEYLAMGIPVVTTDLPEIRRFNTEHGNVITIARDTREFTEAIRGGGGSSPTDAERRIDVARLNSWQARISRMAEVIEQALAARRSLSTGMRWEESLGRLYRTARRRIMRPLLGIVLLYGVLFYTPLVWVLGEPLRIADEPQQADVIVVFAGGAGESGRPGQGYEERVAWAVDLYRQGYADKLIFSSGSTYKFQEPEVMKALAVFLGVPSHAILVEAQSSSTRQNVIYSNQLLDQHEWNDALMVSSPYHMRRTSLVWRRIAPDKRITFVPIPESRFYRHGRDAQGRPTWRQASLKQIRSLLHEYLGILYYRLRGWI